MLNTNLNDKFNCKICGKENMSRLDFEDHIVIDEGMTQQEYFDTYIKPEHLTEGTCKICGKPTRFRDVTIGYENYCSAECCDKDSNRLTFEQKVLI